MSEFKNTGWASLLLIIALVTLSSLGEVAVAGAGIGVLGIIINLIMSAGALAIAVGIVVNVFPQANFNRVYKIGFGVFGGLLVLVLASLWIEPVTAAELVGMAGIAVQVTGLGLLVLLGLWTSR